MLRYEMSLWPHEERPLRECDRDAFTLLDKHKVLPHNMKEYLYREYAMIELRKLCYEVRKERKKFFSQEVFDENTHNSCS
jgi:hypothetical protein